MSARPIRTFTPPPNPGRAGSSDSSSLKSFLDKGPGIPIPRRQDPNSPELKSALSKSAPTTPGPSKKHAHFDDVKIEHRYSLHRTITAPSSFESTPSLLFPDPHDSTLQHLDPVNVEDSPPQSADESSNAEESDDSTGVYMDATDSRSLLRRSNTADSMRISPKHVMTRWSSDPQQRTVKMPPSDTWQAVASTLQRGESDSSHSNKSATSSIVGGTLQLPDDDMTTASNTSRSASEKALRRTPTKRQEIHSRHDLATEKVDWKLTEWSKERRGGGFERHSPVLIAHRRESRPPSGDEGVPGPPNTGRSSLTPSRPESASRSLATTPGSDPPTPTCILKSAETRSSSPVQSPDYSTMSNLSRAFLSMSERDKFQLTHRDSLDVHRKHIEDHRSDASSHHLVNAKDSFLINKNRFEKYPKSGRLLQPTFSRLTIGGLSPIQDASPPDPRQYLTKSNRESKRPSRNGTSIVPEDKPGVATSAEIRGHPESDHDCPICLIERPRTTAQRQAS
ncbi:hypothetical protein KVT40_005869 [Elsinoe batatas]|uniref:Uncharacterized protein n=1 Tax=Elsinoe batatas TaxID=2601811 RepID=A0A8K0PIR5_9PEZI|nr:hypothetical protein KVT40_005869 [Elsinoe batatas]